MAVCVSLIHPSIRSAHTHTRMNSYIHTYTYKPTQMVMFRHGRGMTEAQVQKVVIQTLDQREKVRMGLRVFCLIFGVGGGRGVVVVCV